MVSNAILGLDTLELSRITGGLVAFVPTLVMITIMGGFGEELGWRGFMLPRAQARYSALVASLIVGVLHGLWHVPMFFIEGLSPYQEMAAAANIWVVILGYTVLYVTPWAILWTCLLNNTRGSLLLAIVMHAGEAWVLTSWNIDNINGYIGLSVGMTVLAIIVVIVYGPKNLSHKNERYIIKDN
jgi:membrane protease YdiL (CAAX protease family)